MADVHVCMHKHDRHEDLGSMLFLESLIIRCSEVACEAILG